MNKYYSVLNEDEKKFYSLNCLLTEQFNPTDERNIVDLAKKVESQHFQNKDFLTFIYRKHISRAFTPMKMKIEKIR